MQTLIPRKSYWIVTAIVSAACLAGCRETQTATSAPAGNPTPVSRDHSSPVLDLEGHPFEIWQAGNESAATVLIFTRSDCPISNRYAPTVRKLCEQFRPKGVRFFLVYVDPKEAPEAIRRHVSEYQYPCSALRDPTHALVLTTGATVTPEAVVFDAQRTMTYRGRIDDLYADLGQSRPEATTHELADAIIATLDDRPVSVPSMKAVGCPIADLL